MQKCRWRGEIPVAENTRRNTSGAKYQFERDIACFIYGFQHNEFMQNVALVSALPARNRWFRAGRFGRQPYDMCVHPSLHVVRFKIVSGANSELLFPDANFHKNKYVQIWIPLFEPVSNLVNWDCILDSLSWTISV